MEERPGKSWSKKEKTRTITMYTPKIKFKTAQGMTKTFKSKDSSSSMNYAVGKKVDVFYVPGKEKRFEIDRGFWSNYLPALIFGGAGFIVFVIGLFLGRKVINNHFV